MFKLSDSPYLVMASFGVVILALICVRRLLCGAVRQQEILIGNAQARGKRAEQEDSFATVTNTQGILAVLADGMGGYAEGKCASRIVAGTFVEQFSSGGIDSIPQFFQKTSVLCNQKIMEIGKTLKSGSTLAAAVITEGQLYWVAVGDSAVIMYRGGELRNLNKKHIFQTMLEAQYQSGKITKDEMLRSPKRKRLTSFLGHDGFREIALNGQAIKLFPGDKIILCSDGVYNSLSELELEKILVLNLEPQAAAEKIINKITAKNYVNQDNATIIILAIR
jgi:serine/threonine protein phosphatase PrpC